METKVRVIRRPNVEELESSINLELSNLPSPYELIDIKMNTLSSSSNGGVYYFAMIIYSIYP